MKKYGLVTLLSLSFISHATSKTTTNVDEYYKKTLESIQELNTANSETAENIYERTKETTAKIQEIQEKLRNAQSSETQKPEELQQLQIELSILQAKLQVDTLKIQSLSMIQAKNAKTKEEMSEEAAQKKHEDIAKKLKEKLENSNVRL
ncbi:chromosome segregation ATPase [Bartonella silvatica]|uniref:Chromosome segregation ATPase n=1 Tax=Bartonella silvatica TaxID=357760 RepID=A0ABV2HHD1_9HYPH